MGNVDSWGCWGWVLWVYGNSILSGKFFYESKIALKCKVIDFLKSYLASFNCNFVKYEM